jgi:hypothetical protein
MTRWVRHRLGALVPLKVGLTVGLTALFAVGWLAIPRWRAGAAHTLPVTALEAGIPFVEEFAYVYLSIVLFMPLAPYLTVSRPALLRHGAGFAGLTLGAFVCFVLYPVRTPEPAGAGSTALFSLLVLDGRLNNLPSLHAGYTVYSLLYWREVLPEIQEPGARRATALVLSAWAGLILASVLLTKQHYLVDVVAGSLAGALAYALAFRGRPGLGVPGLRPFCPSPEMNP